MQFGTFITNLAAKAGINQDSIKDLLTANLTIPDDLALKMDESLFSLDAAKQNQQLKGYFHAQALSVPDNQINDLLNEMGFADDIKSEFANERSTPKKIKMLTQKVDAKYKKLIDEMKNGDSEGKEARIEKLTKEIEKLNGDIKSKDDDWSSLLNAMEKKNHEDKLNFVVKNTLAAKKYADDKRPQELNVEFANLLLQRELANKKAKIVLNQDGTIGLVQLENPDLKFMENHKEVSFGDFADRTLAGGNLLSVTPAAKATVNAPIQPVKGEFQVPQSIIDSYDRQLKVFANGGNS